MSENTVLEVSKEFQGISAFNREYKAIREAIIKRHGFIPGQKVRLVRAVMLYVDYGYGFIKYTDNLTDMKDRVKMHEVTGSGKKFLLKAMV